MSTANSGVQYTPAIAEKLIAALKLMVEVAPDQLSYVDRALTEGRETTISFSDIADPRIDGQYPTVAFREALQGQGLALQELVNKRIVTESSVDGRGPTDEYTVVIPANIHQWTQQASAERLR